MNKSGFVSILVVSIVIAFAIYYRTGRSQEATPQTSVTSPPPSASAPATNDDGAKDELLDMPAAIGEDAPIVTAEKSGNTPSGTEVATVGTQSAQAAETKRPRLVDLGADKCIPCKKLTPILDALREEYKGKLDVEFIDVWKNPSAQQPYNIRLNPTQILYDANGNEVWRHEGFIAKEDLKKLFAEKVGVK